MEEAGLAVWPPDESADADAIEDAGEETGRDRGRGQGPSLSAAERALVERHAMEVATRHFQKNGWTVEDVPTAIALRPSMPARGQDAVTCRGETSPAGLPLSSSPVTKSWPRGPIPSRDARHRARDNARSEPREGNWRGIEDNYPWKLDDSALRPIAYQYEVPVR